MGTFARLCVTQLILVGLIKGVPHFEPAAYDPIEDPNYYAAPASPLSNTFLLPQKTAAKRETVASNIPQYYMEMPPVPTTSPSTLLVISKDVSHAAGQVPSAYSPLNIHSGWNSVDGDGATQHAENSGVEDGADTKTSSDYVLSSAPVKRPDTTDSTESAKETSQKRTSSGDGDGDGTVKAISQKHTSSGDGDGDGAHKASLPKQASGDGDGDGEAAEASAPAPAPAPPVVALPRNVTNSTRNATKLKAENDKLEKMCLDLVWLMVAFGLVALMVDPVIRTCVGCCLDKDKKKAEDGKGSDADDLEKDLGEKEDDKKKKTKQGMCCGSTGRRPDDTEEVAADRENWKITPWSEFSWKVPEDCSYTA